MLGAKPQAAEARAKSVTPSRNTRRRPRRSPSAPPTRISAERKSPYDSMTHCISTTLAWKALWNFGAATLTTVLSMKAMLEPRIVAARIHGPEFLAQGVAGRTGRMEISSQRALMIGRPCQKLDAYDN